MGWILVVWITMSADFMSEEPSLLSYYPTQAECRKALGRVEQSKRLHAVCMENPIKESDKPYPRLI